MVLMLAAVTVGVGDVGLVGLLTRRWSSQKDAARATHPSVPKPARAAQALSEPLRPAIEQPRESHWHVHIPACCTIPNVSRIAR
jgi:hypothetical protein